MAAQEVARRLKAAAPRASGVRSRMAAARRLRTLEGRSRLEETPNLPVAQPSPRAQQEAIPRAAAPRPRVASRPRVAPALPAGARRPEELRPRPARRPPGEGQAAARRSLERPVVAVPSGEHPAVAAPSGEKRVARLRPGERPAVAVPAGEERAERRPAVDPRLPAGPRPQADPRVPPGIRPPVAGTRRC